MDANIEFCNLLAETLPLYHQAMNSSFSGQKVTPSQAELLFVLEKEGRSKVTDLALLVNTPASNISNIATRLEKMGLVIRERNESDRRIVELELTEAAHPELEKMTQAKAVFFDKVKRAVPAVNFEELNRSLEIIREILSLTNEGESR